jgi:hypothetical protein
MQDFRYKEKQAMDRAYNDHTRSSEFPCSINTSDSTDLKSLPIVAAEG